MTNLHDITQLLSDTFGFQNTDTPETQNIVGQLLATLLERLITQSYSYLSVEDQQILDGMLDADASPEDVVSFLSERIPTLSEVLSALIAQLKSDTERILDIASDEHMVHPSE